MSRRGDFGALVLVAALAFGPPLARAEAAAPEEQIKAAFLLNFTRFVDWPQLTETADSFNLCILSEESFGAVVKGTLEGKTVHDKRLVVTQPAATDDLRACHILFVGTADAYKLPTILKSLRGASVLTVGETDDFAERGGLINLRMQDDKVRFEINAGAAERSGLRISSQLLKLAAHVIR